ncbi:hypothetical protein EV401DRAFT_1061128 [Pisolithus croceorrhizus]|nr:hypothetical protein EV401DRAFT_1061128 [Pisolithus croceorrhizus]
MMDNIIRRLKAKAEAAPNSTLLKDTISLLEDLQRSPEDVRLISWDALRRDFDRLRERGLWERSAENDGLLDALRDFLVAPSSSPIKPTRPSVASEAESEGFSITISPPQGFTSRLVSNDALVLPVELVEILDRTYFLHLLATDPEQVLPPGKSLLSTMSRPHAVAEGDPKPSLRHRVEHMMHKAFWDEAVENLSNPEPATQLTHLKLLYSDMNAALSTLLPPRHPVLVTTSAPFPPTSSPLESAVSFLREVLVSLRERCAPVHDPEIETVQQALENPPIRTARPRELAKLVADTIRFILEFVQVMKDDLSGFVFGGITEQQLRSVVAKQAKATEREVILDIWRKDRVLQDWRSWLEHPIPSFSVSGDATEPRFRWIVRLVQSLGVSPLPVSCPLPTRDIQTTRTDLNESESPTVSDLDRALPSIFFFTIPALVKIQNYLQALVITAALCVLIRPPLPAAGPSHVDLTTFTTRVWTILQADITEGPRAEYTKLVNLADEVVRARTQCGPTLSKEEEKRLREFVDRTLKPTDPVFVLLRNRLLVALVTALVRLRMESRDLRVVPKTLRSGLDRERDVKRPKLTLDSHYVDERPLPEGSVGVTVKGFEGPVLNRAIAKVLGEMDVQLEWLEGVWGDVIEPSIERNKSKT